MFEVECVGPEEIRVHFACGARDRAPSVDSQIYMKATEARRLAAELLVAVERAERLERDMRAPG